VVSRQGITLATQQVIYANVSGHYNCLMIKTIVKYSLLGVLISLALIISKSFRQFGMTFISISLFTGQLAGLALYIMESQIFTTKFFRFILLGIAVFLIGVLFKIQHWSYSSTFTICAILIISITYLLRFILKKNKTLIDFIKAIWLILVLFGYLFYTMHWYGSTILIYSAYGVFWVGLLQMLTKDIKLKRERIENN
jgi:hypothetical protein